MEEKSGYVDEKSGYADEKSGYDSGYQSYVELCPYVTSQSTLSLSSAFSNGQKLTKSCRVISQVKSMMLTDAGSDEPLCPYHS